MNRNVQWSAITNYRLFFHFTLSGFKSIRECQPLNAKKSFLDKK